MLTVFWHKKGPITINFSEFKPVKLHLKIDFVSYPARAEGLVNRITINFFEKSATINIAPYCQFLRKNSPYLLNGSCTFIQLFFI